MSSFSPPLYNSDIFNSGLFITNTEALTIDVADARYIRIGGFGYLAGLNVAGNIDAASITISGAPLNLSAITGVTPGIAVANKALIVDSSINITNINSLSATSLTGTLQTASQPNITTLGNITTGNLNVVGTITNNNNVTINGTGSILTLTSSSSSIKISGNQPSNSSSTGCLIADGGIYVGKDSIFNQDLDINGNLTLGSTVISETDIAKIDGITNGTAAANKALVLDASLNITGINSLSATSLTGTLQTASQPNITDVGTLNGLLIAPTNKLVATGQTSVNCVFASTLDRRYGMRQIDTNNFVMLCYSAGGTYNDYITWTHAGTPNLNVSGSLNVTGLYLNSTLITSTATELNYLSGITPGTITASKAIVVDASSNINSTIRCFKSASGQQLRFEAGTSTGVVFHNLNGSLFFGSISANDVILQSNNIPRVTITSNGNVNIANSVSGLQLDLGNTGTGANLPNLTFRGTTFNDTYYTGITLGGAVSEKAVVLNSTLDYSGIRDLSITRNFIASTSIASPSITCDSLSATVGVTTASLTVNGDVNVTANWFANGTQILNSSRQMQNIAYLDFSNSSLLYKTIIRKDTSGGAGIEFYDTQFSTPTQRPIINFKTGNNDEPIFFRMCGYLSDNDGSGAYPANGCPFTINYINDASWDSGLRLGCINQSQATNNAANIGLWARNSTIPHFIAQDRFNQAHIKPKSADLNSQITGFGVVVGENTVFNGGGVNEMRGNATVLSLHNTTGGTSDRISFTMDHNTQWEMSLGGSAHSTVPNGLYWYNGSYKMILTSSGRLGVGGANPRCGLEVSGSVNQTTIPFGTNTFSYNVSNNSWTNHGGGPFTYSVCAWFNGNIYVNNSIYNASDRRLKENIKTLDVDIDHYKEINPVSYSYKNETNTQIGFIAQEMRGVCAESVSYADNENLKVEEEGDIEGVQMNIDYKQISVLNCAIIKKLIDKIEKLEYQIELLNNYNPIKKFLQKNNNKNFEEFESSLLNSEN